MHVDAENRRKRKAASSPSVIIWPSQLSWQKKAGVKMSQAADMAVTWRAGMVWEMFIKERRQA